MPKTNLIIAVWIALSAASGFASDPPAPFMPSDAAPLAPILPPHPDSQSFTPNYGPVNPQDAADGPSSNLKRDLIQATGGGAAVTQTALPETAANQTFAPPTLPNSPSGPISNKVSC